MSDIHSSILPDTLRNLPDILNELITKTRDEKDTEPSTNELEAAKMQTEEAWKNEYLMQRAIHDAYVDVTKAQITRTQARAEFIEKAAGTIATAYTAILGLTYSVDALTISTDTQRPTNPLPVQGIVPVFFLGLAVVCAAIYHGYITRASSERHQLGAGRLDQVQDNRLDIFMDWALDYVYARRQWMHRAIYSLGVGIVLLPVAYFATSDTGSLVVWALSGVGLCLVIFLPMIVDPLLGDTDPKEDGATPAPKNT